MIESTCKFCSSTDTKSSKGQRKVSYDGALFEFIKCGRCTSYFLAPNLTEKQLEKLYSTEYVEGNDHISEIEEGENKFLEINAFLHTYDVDSTSKFLDYGCGVDSQPIMTAKSLGFECYGMEYETEIRSIANKKCRVPIFSKEEFLNSDTTFDVIFLGDVLEHLIEPNADLAEIANKLSHNGVIYIQGPLQGSATLLHAFVKLLAYFTKKRSSNYPPYHVNLFSFDGMRYLINNCGLEIQFVKVTEVDWPAMSAKQLKSNFSFRSAFLFLLKFTDKFMSKMLKHYGTRINIICSKRL
jgi:2-polyprenyl-3-methyl-5-hydroxy-6-metoxy-1,4-benzoquinol methylase